MTSRHRHVQAEENSWADAAGATAAGFQMIVAWTRASTCCVQATPRAVWAFAGVTSAGCLLRAKSTHVLDTSQPAQHLVAAHSSGAARVLLANASVPQAGAAPPANSIHARPIAAAAARASQECALANVAGGAPTAHARLALKAVPAMARAKWAAYALATAAGRVRLVTPGAARTIATTMRARASMVAANAIQDGAAPTARRTLARP